MTCHHSDSHRTPWLATPLPPPPPPPPPPQIAPMASLENSWRKSFTNREVFCTHEPSAASRRALRRLQRPFRGPFRGPILRWRDRSHRRHDAAAAANDVEYEPNDGRNGWYVWWIRRHGHDGHASSHAHERICPPQPAAAARRPPLARLLRPHRRRARR